MTTIDTLTLQTIERFHVAFKCLETHYEFNWVEFELFPFILMTLQFLMDGINTYGTR